MSGRRCPATRCPKILTNGKRYCPGHEAEYLARRGTTTQRGYGAAHQRRRARWQQRIDDGETILCALCHTPVAGRAWHLDHTPDGRGYRGPAHVSCNTSDGGARGAAITNGTS